MGELRVIVSALHEENGYRIALKGDLSSGLAFSGITV